MCCDTRDQNLATVTRTFDSRRPVDRRAEEVTTTLMSLSSVQIDPHTDRRRFAPDSTIDGGLDVTSGLCGRVSSLKRRGE